MKNSSEIIERLCKLQALVVEKVLGFENSADCFCEKGGYWKNEGYGGTFEQGYRNNGKALEFIEDAVNKKINAQQDFETWWYNEGSAPPKDGVDHDEHCKKMCQIAWENGAYKALEESNNE